MTEPIRLDVSAYKPGARHDPHSHDDLQISVVLRGAVEERVGTRVERAAALSVVVKDPQVTHADEFGRNGALIVRLMLPGVGIADLVDHPDRAHPWRWTHDAAVAAPFLRLAQRGSRGQTAFDAYDDDLLDLLAAMSARPAPPAETEPPTWLRDAIRGIEQEWRPGLTVRDVANSVGVHPVYLARCVRRWYRSSAGDLIRLARLRRVAAAVADGGCTVSSVAHSHGYSDEPHLCREFSRTTGFSPGRLRRLARDCERLIG